MPEFWFWGLLASVIVLAIGTTLKAVEFRFELQMANKVINGLWKEIDTLKGEDDNTIPDKPELEHRESPKVSHNTKHYKFPFYEVLIAVARYHSQEIPATPKLISQDINLDPEITLAYMWRYHNDQFMTFRTGRTKPGVETPFFLSPKAMEHIKITSKTGTKNKQHQTT